MDENKWHIINYIIALLEENIIKNDIASVIILTTVEFLPPQMAGKGAECLPIFILAIKHRRLEILKILIKRLPIDRLVIWLCETDEVDVVSFCSENDEDFKYKSLNNLLRICAKYNSYNIAKYLIENGADINKGDENNITPLQTACYQSSFEVVKLLCAQSNIELNKIDKYNRNVVHVACYNNNPEIVTIMKLLLSICSSSNGNGIDVNLIDGEGDTALAIACQCENRKVVEYLLSIKDEFGILINEQNKYIRKYKIKHPELFDGCDPAPASESM